MDIKAINFIDTHCAGPLREARMQSLADLLEEVRAETREMCRLAGMGAAQEYTLSDSARLIHEVGEAIVNATGEK